MQLHFTGGKAKAIRTHHHPGVWERTETSPELQAPSLGLHNSQVLKSLETEASSLEDHSVLSCFFNIEPAWLQLWGLWETIPFSLFHEPDAYRHARCSIGWIQTCLGLNFTGVWLMYWRTLFYLYISSPVSKEDSRRLTAEELTHEMSTIERQSEQPFGEGRFS